MLLVQHRAPHLHHTTTVPFVAYLNMVHWGLMQIKDCVPTAAHAYATCLQLFLVILNKARRSSILIHKLREVKCVYITHTCNVTVCLVP